MASMGAGTETPAGVREGHAGSPQQRQTRASAPEGFLEEVAFEAGLAERERGGWSLGGREHAWGRRDRRWAHGLFGAGRAASGRGGPGSGDSGPGKARVGTDSPGRFLRTDVSLVGGEQGCSPSTELRFA